ncbi:hypothetical protein MANES_14G037800v8 [Manihot esculenta]|uniref:Uncharacterized protein n=2 Tax=Manihot esculenta TaxID=3983 RepID=A0ACB7GIF8_MANES|nr:hypothetical protein MANES_14G037800v8 [Manihot esculenta]
MRVSLRFPSIYSLRAYFSETNCTKTDVKKLPALDEKYIIGSEVAAEVLYRRITPHEISAKRNSWHFWAVPSIAAEEVSTSHSNSKPRSTVVPKKGSLWSELKGTGMLKWGQRRQVRYLARHVEDKRKQKFSSKVPDKEEEEEAGDEEEENAMEVASDEGEEEKASDDEKEEDEKAGKSRETKTNRKRNHQASSCKSQNNSKRPKNEMQNQIVAYKQKKNKVLKNSIDRWSVERYKLAEVNMLKIMKEQGAVFGKPILRPELRAQARKLIGDTGLLDHLLKHMAGKVAPGGEERFRRRHNAEGAMEYWLEKADLVDIRREAGVQDPYWTPPPGWKTGDNPTQDPLCAREIRNLKEEIAKLKRDMEEQLSKKHEEELAIVTSQISSVTSHDIEHEKLLTPLKEMYIDLVNKKVKIEEQLMEISQSLCGMEEQMGKLKTAMEEAKRTESSEGPALMRLPESTSPAVTQKKRKEAIMQQKKEETVPRELRQEHSKAGCNRTPPTAKSPSPADDKAAKIERLKSGFRICKPQGTFLWPNMVISSPQVVVQLEDLFAVPTPPSVSSTSATQPHLLPAPPPQHDEPIPTSPLKPLAEKGPVTIALPTAVSRQIHSSDDVYGPQYENSSISTTSATSTNTTTITSQINLNEPPCNIQNDNGLTGSHSQGQTSTYPVTYQRRGHHTVTAIAAMPCLEPAKKEMNQWEGGKDEGKEMMRYCEQEQQGCCSAASTCPCLSVEVGAWLALATSNQPLENKSKRG